MMRRRFREIRNDEVYFPMRELGMRRLLPQTVDLARACVAIHDVGSVITTRLIREITGKKHITERMHLLGDKGFVMNIRGGKQARLKWVVSPDFMRLFRGEPPIQRTR